MSTSKIKSRRGKKLKLTIQRTGHQLTFLTVKINLWNSITPLLSISMKNIRAFTTIESARNATVSNYLGLIIAVSARSA